MAGRQPGKVDYQYKGPKQRRVFFEGWYFKLELDKETTLSLIPSLHKGREESHGQLQWLLSQGKELTSGSFHYPVDEAALRFRPFHLRLGNSEFSEQGIRIREPDLSLAADFDELRPYAGDIMGPFRFLHQHMPCSHGLLITEGSARVSLSSPELTGVFHARLYVEKDWGDTFPERYIWMHADFPEDDSSFFFSIATVEVGPIGFTGFIANLVLDGVDHTFATWNLSDCIVRGSPRDIRVGLSGHGLKLAVRIQPQDSVPLKSPLEGAMTDHIRESLSAPIRLKIRNEQGNEREFITKRASVECTE